MTKKRFKKLQMSVGYTRDEAEIIALLARREAMLADGLYYYPGPDVYVAAGYEFFWLHCAIADDQLTRVMKVFGKKGR